MTILLRKENAAFSFKIAKMQEKCAFKNNLMIA